MDTIDQHILPLGDTSPSEILQLLDNLWAAIKMNCSEKNKVQLQTIQHSIEYIFQSIQDRKTNRIQKEADIKMHYINMLGLLMNESDSFQFHNIGLTRSGLSAVCSGVELASLYLKSIGKEACYFVKRGFYFEAGELVEHRTKKKVEDSAEANIYCVNVAPNTACKTNFPGAVDDVYSNERDKLLYEIYQKALVSTEDIFLIFDTTTNLFFPLYHDLEIPPNLHIMKVASLTKYRNGDQNHFAGINLLYSHNTSVLHLMDEAIVRGQGTVSTRNVAFFIKSERSEVETLYEHFQYLQSEFREGFEIKASNIRKKNKYWDWRIESCKDAPQFCFIVPPMDTIIEHFLEGIDNDEKPETIFKNDLYVERLCFPYMPLSYGFNTYLLGFRGMLEWLGHLNEDDMRVHADFGSSFGLRRTRVSYYGNSFVYDGKMFRALVPRICFGIEATGSEMFLLGKYAGKFIESIFNCHTTYGYLRGVTKENLSRVYDRLEKRQDERNE